MDKNTITGFILIAAVLIGFSWFSQPSAEELAAQRKQDSITRAAREKAEQDAAQAKTAREAAAKAQAQADSTAAFHAALSGTSEDIVLKNSCLELTVSTKGAMVTKAVVKGFKNYKGDSDVTLFEGTDQHLRFLLSGKETNIITSDLFFTPSAQSDSTVTLTADAGSGRQLVLRYSLGDDYLLRLSLQAVGMSGMFAPNYREMDVEWFDRCRQQERGFNFENQRSSLTYHLTEGGTDYLNEQKEAVDKALDDETDWVAFKNQYFSAVMITEGNFAPGALLTSVPLKKDTRYLKQYGARLKTQFDPTGTEPSRFEFYYGPNDFRLLQDIEKKSSFDKDLELERLVYLGWPLIRIINRWFTIYVFDWLTKFGLNMGIVLILITLLLKAITFPLVKKSYMSSAKMRVLKPKLDELTKQYDKPEDQMQKQQAMMSLYAQYGVSPLGGCLPMLIQMPIWIAMFNYVPNAIQLRGESFLWMNDLSTYDPIVEWSKSIWLIGDHLSLTCILFCVANVLYSWMTMRQQRDQMVGQQAEQMKMMQWMMYLMPVMFFFMFNEYSSGLNFYYFVSLFFSAAIMWTLRKTTNDAKLLAILEARYEENKKNPKKQSGLAARLEAMQRQAAELEKQRKQGFTNK